MSATAEWTVHCHGCSRWDEQHESRAEAERVARRAGWLVETKRAGGTNLCPDCRAEGREPFATLRDLETGEAIPIQDVPLTSPPDTSSGGDAK